MLFAMLLDQHANSLCQPNCSVVLLGCCIHIDDFLIGENGGMADGMAECQNGGWNGGMAEWLTGMADGMAEWRNG